MHSENRFQILTMGHLSLNDSRALSFLEANGKGDGCDRDYFNLLPRGLAFRGVDGRVRISKKGAEFWSMSKLSKHIRSTTDSLGKAKFLTSERQQEVLLKLQETFSDSALSDWVDYMLHAEGAQSRAARARNGGKDLMDAMRGTYDRSYCVSLVKSALR